LLANVGFQGDFFRSARSDDERFVTLSVAAAKQDRSVGGAVFHDGKPLILSIKGRRPLDFLSAGDGASPQGRATDSLRSLMAWQKAARARRAADIFKC
jgi:hypothetical protein